MVNITTNVYRNWFKKDGLKEVGYVDGRNRICLILMSVLTDLKARGVEDILSARTSIILKVLPMLSRACSLKLLPSLYCHQIRNSCKLCCLERPQPFCADLKDAYTVPPSCRRTSNDRLCS